MATAAVLEPTEGIDARGLDWATLLSLSAATVGLLHGAIAVVLTDIDAAALFVLFAIALAAHRRWRRRLTPVLGLLLLDVAFFTGAATGAHLANGATAGALAIPVVMLSTSTVGLVAAFGAWRAPHSSRGAAVAVVVGAVLLVAPLAATAVSAGPTVPAAGDLQIVGSGIRFAPDQIQAPAGTVGVHLTNRDYFWHTFSVPELGVRLAVPMNGQGRVEFEAPAGTYDYVCEIPGHESVMRGHLTITP